MEGAVFKNKALVTSMNPYSFTTEDKREMTGVTIEFLMTETLEPCKEGETNPVCHGVIWFGVTSHGNIGTLDSNGICN
jgi:hypothetical protein